MEGIRACVFDAYGTLFDVHAAVGRLRSQIGPRADELSGSGAPSSWNTLGCAR